MQSEWYTLICGVMKMQADGRLYGPSYRALYIQVQGPSLLHVRPPPYVEDSTG